MLIYLIYKLKKVKNKASILLKYKINVRKFIWMERTDDKCDGMIESISKNELHSNYVYGI